MSFALPQLIRLNEGVHVYISDYETRIIFDASGSTPARPSFTSLEIRRWPISRLLKVVIILAVDRIGFDRDN